MSAITTCPKWSEIFTDAPAGATTALSIDLDALVANWRALAALAARAAPAKAAAVVKADGYGLGAPQIVPALHAAGCRDFFVAHLSEAAALRPVLPADATLSVLNGLAGAAPRDFTALKARPVLNSAAEIEAWLAAGADPAQALIHLDSGMSRLGLAPAEWAALRARRPEIERLPWAALMSHLACADEPDHPLNTEQLTRFQALTAGFEAIPRSLSASSGIFLGPDYCFDLVRPGVAMYGGAPTSATPNPMRPVVHLAAKLLQVREIDAGDSVGYGGRHRVTRPSRIAAIAVGYADGWMRASAGRGWAWIDGPDATSHRLPILGRISMDLITLDVTDAPPPLVQPGAVVSLLGDRRGVDDLAADWGTISYEVLTQLGRRHYRRWGQGVAAA